MLENLTIIIIAQDEADNLTQLLPQLGWVKQVVVVGNNCSDETRAVAERQGAVYVSSVAEDFAAVRNLALAKVKTEWIFYLDADERVTPKLQAEIAKTIDDQSLTASALTLRRENYNYGYKMEHGGWERDLVTRIFRRRDFVGWTGVIHESPEFAGANKVLTRPLLHLTHRNTQANLAKSSQWTIKEAELLAQNRLHPVRKSTILRKVLMEFYRRYFKLRGYKDGMAGFVESLTQAFNRGFVYMQVWELQQEPSIEARYGEIEKKLRR